MGTDEGTDASSGTWTITITELVGDPPRPLADQAPGSVGVHRRGSVRPPEVWVRSQGRIEARR